MEKRIITISREFGSGGRTIGKLVAEHLGIRCYDAELIQKLAVESGFDENYVKEAGEYTPGGFLASAFTDRSFGPTNEDLLWKLQYRIIRELAEKEPCVIVGRCADFILQDRTDCLKVFVHADMKFRADRIVRVYGEREKSPEARLKALNVELLLDMMLAQDPDIQTVGLLYSTSEVNSAPAIEDAKAYLDSKGIGYLEKTGNTSDEIIAAVSSMTGQVDAVFTPTDNVVQAAELAIAPTLADAGIPHYAGADSFVRNGAFATCGVNYTDLGSQTADLAVEVLTTGQIPEYVTVAGDIITVNTETAAALGADYSKFADMGSQLVEVQTTQD